MFTTTKLAENLYHIEDSYSNCASLILGKRRAVLLDTAFGEDDIRSYIEELTKLPVTVINSHCHLDHIGGNCLFDTVYINRDELEVIDSIEKHLSLHPSETVNQLPYCLTSLREKDRFRDICPGEELDLGGITLQVVDLKGHTPGSIGLLLKEQRILLAGDAFSPQACLFFPESLDLDEYRNTLEQTMKLPFDRFVLSHSRKMYPKSLLNRFIECCRLPGNQKGYPFSYSLIPDYTGKIYFLEYDNPDADGIICIIVKENDANVK